jgi:hypothetical protein
LPTQYKDFQTRKYQLKPRLSQNLAAKKGRVELLISGLGVVRDGFDQKRQHMKLPRGECAFTRACVQSSNPPELR